MHLFDLTGRVAIVTGGNGGIGLGMARGMAAAGARIVIAARNGQKAAAAIAELEALGIQARFVPVDVSDEASVNAMVAAAAAAFGRIDILVNNAGFNIRRPPQDYTLDDFHKVVDTNLTSVFLCAKAVYPHMKAAGGGKIINIGSMASLFGNPPFTAYAASKGGMVQLSRVLATAWAADHIQVNTVLPGWIDTDLTRVSKVQMPGLNERVLERTPEGRWGRPEDFAGIAVFLASAASDYVTGTAIPVDGGFSISG